MSNLHSMSVRAASSDRGRALIFSDNVDDHCMNP